MYDKWELMRVVMYGDDDYNTTAAYDKTLIDYLPTTFKADDKERFAVYAERAVFSNYTENTVFGLRGMATRLEPTEYELPSTIEYLADDWDGNGSDKDQLIKQTITELEVVGRIGGLVDYPQAEEGMSEEQVSQLDLMATFAIYKAESILDWRVQRINGHVKLKMVKLAEDVEDWSDLTTRTTKKQFRVLGIDDAGKYYYYLADAEDKPLTDDIYPKTQSGAKWDFIPFCFGGAEDNKSSVDKPPLYSIAKLNLAHYRNSADYEENLFVHGQGTFILDTGLMTNDQVDQAFPNGIKVGARSGIAGAGFKGAMLQIDASGALPVAMDNKVKSMIQLGADVIRDRSSNETAKAATIDANQRTSKLTTIVNNAENFIIKLHQYATGFMGGDPEQVEIELNKDFYDNTIDPQLLAQMIMLKDDGIIAKSDIRRKLKKVDVLDADRIDEEIDAEVDTDGFGRGVNITGAE